MKKVSAIYAVIFLFTIISCKKASQDLVTLTPSTTLASVGETISITVSSNANAVSWTVTPAAAVTKTFGITTQKVNYFSFSTPGSYTVGVRARSIDYDSTRHQSLDSCWRNGGGDRGGCRHGIDSASVIITVK